MLVLAGCATTDAVLFVTKTSLGIDFDAKPAAASIAYDRTEGYIAPSYANGEIPPVVASIKSDAKIFNPKIRQIYATGDAAVIAVSKNSEATLKILDPNYKKQLKGEKKLMFFGTSTTTGLKVGFTSYAPDSFVFGFKRKEYSFIPLGKHTEDGNTYDVYPSVLASIDTDATAGRANEEGAASGDTSLSNSQFFATGRAARELAANPAISDAFKAQASMSLRAKQEKRLDEFKAKDGEEKILVKDIQALFKAADNDTEKEEIVKLTNMSVIAFLKENKPGEQVTILTFDDRLLDFQENDQPSGVDKLVVLKDLKNRIHSLPQ